MRAILLKVIDPISYTVAADRSLGSFSYDDGDGNVNAKKTMGLLNKKTSLHVHHAVLYVKKWGENSQAVHALKTVTLLKINSVSILIFLNLTIDFAEDFLLTISASYKGKKKVTLISLDVNKKKKKLEERMKCYENLTYHKKFILGKSTISIFVQHLESDFQTSLRFCK